MLIFTGLTITPSLTITQNYSKSGLMFFVRLLKELGVGTISFFVTSSGKWAMRFDVYNWSNILGVCKHYFKFVYGEKFIAFDKLAKINQLRNESSLNSKALAVQLVYSLSTSGSSRKVELVDKLRSMNLPVNLQTLPVFNNNHITPTFHFILGLLLGDGSFYIRLRNSKGFINIIPLVSLAQLNTKLNQELLSIISHYFTSIGVTHSYKSTGDMVNITIEGVTNVVGIILPLLLENINFIYWKKDQLLSFIKVCKLMAADLHLTKAGLLVILDLCYSNTNKRGEFITW